MPKKEVIEVPEEEKVHQEESVKLLNELTCLVGNILESKFDNKKCSKCVKFIQYTCIIK